MERWQGKVAVVTGASSGIGWSITRDLLAAGMHVVGLARRLERMLQARDTLPDAVQRAHFQPLACDLNSLTDIRGAFERIEQQYDGRLHVLINNAGMAKFTQLLDANNEATLQEVINVNLMGTVHCTKQAFRLMQGTLAKATTAIETGSTTVAEQCHVINVNSLLGHTVPPHIPACGFNLYPVAKHAIRACNEILRREFYAYDKTRIRLSNISPGLTETEFGESAGGGLSGLPDFGGSFLQPADVSRSICFILAAPAHVNVAELVLVPTCEAY